MAPAPKTRTTQAPPPKDRPGLTRVAIACQGGGSHTAFTAGVLSSLLTSEEYEKKFRIIALSGTSGGALCAGIAWSRLLHPAHGAPLSRAERRQQGRAAAQALKDFWLDLACEPAQPALDNQLLFPWRFPLWQRGPFDYMDTAANALWQAAAQLNPFGEAECKLVSQLTLARLEELFARHLPFKLVEGKHLAQQRPWLRIGAANICEGWTMPLRMEDYPPKAFHQALLSSAAIPPLFQPVRLNGNWFWDGLYAHNPPLECLANPRSPQGQNTPNPEEVPQEIWIIQINPEKSSHLPRNTAELMDRRNELMGNLSLAAEMYHIDAMNWLLKRHPISGYRQITLRLLMLDLDLSLASKYNRSRDHIAMLLERGQDKAGEFFKPTSLWESKPEGVDRARLSCRGEPQFRAMPELASTAACTTPCPANALCKTFSQIGSWETAWFNLGQKCFEGGVKAPQ